MNAEMMQKLIDFGAMQERSRNEFMVNLITQYVPVIGDEVQPMVPMAKPIRVASRRGRKPGSNGLATQIRALLGEDGGTVEDIATATGEPSKKITAALNSMKARGIVSKAGKCWSLAGSNGAGASI